VFTISIPNTTQLYHCKACFLVVPLSRSHSQSHLSQPHHTPMLPLEQENLNRTVPPAAGTIGPVHSTLFMCRLAAAAFLLPATPHVHQFEPDGTKPHLYTFCPIGKSQCVPGLLALARRWSDIAYDGNLGTWPCEGWLSTVTGMTNIAGQQHRQLGAVRKQYSTHDTYTAWFSLLCTSTQQPAHAGLRMTSVVCASLLQRHCSGCICQTSQ
jgi:hypothetical protein